MGMTMIISERIFYVMEKRKMTQTELSKKTGIPTSTICDWKRKKTNPQSDYIMAISEALEVSPEQLLTGRGIDPDYKNVDVDCEITSEDIKILKQIHSLGYDQYRRLMAYLKALQKLEEMESIVEE